MNNIGTIRNSRGLSQSDLVEMLGCPSIDVPLLSKIENDIVRPTPDVAHRLAENLGCSIADFYCDPIQLNIFSETEFCEQKGRDEIPFHVMELLSALHYGHENAVSSRTLCRELDCSPRRLRKLIEDASFYGYMIANYHDGMGYFLISNAVEANIYYQQERNRAISILTRIKPVYAYRKAEEHP